MFADPSQRMADPDIINRLQTQAFLPDRHRQPQGPLIIFKTIATDPCRALWKLNVVKNNKNIWLPGLVKETRVRDEVGLVGAYYHGSNLTSALKLEVA